MKTPRTPDQALALAFSQSTGNDPAFQVGRCKAETRELYNVDSDGARSAAAAWLRTDDRIKVAGDKAPRGALVWWRGGSDGNGHVAIADGHGYVWSVDIKRPGRWDRVPFATIGATWHKLIFAGVSRDIDGVRVLNEPSPARPPADTNKGRLTKLGNQLNEDRIVDLDLLDDIIKHGKPAAVAAAAIVAKWAAINGVRAVLRAGRS